MNECIEHSGEQTSVLGFMEQHISVEDDDVTNQKVKTTRQMHYHWSKYKELQ